MFQKTQCGLWESITWMSLPFSKNQSCYKTKLAINTHDHSSWVFVFPACKYHKYYLTCFNMQNFYFLAKNKCAWGTRLWPITYHKLNSYQVSHRLYTLTIQSHSIRARQLWHRNICRVCTGYSSLWWDDTSFLWFKHLFPDIQTHVKGYGKLIFYISSEFQ